MSLVFPVQSGAPRLLRVRVLGVVQGVGFRPFVYRLATELGLNGWVRNSAGGVEIEVEGEEQRLERFLARLQTDKPTHCLLNAVEHRLVDPIGHKSFEIRESVEGEKTVWVLPDIATCAQCIAEVFDPSNRRYLYPFANCTNCGPRFSIMEALPYDRVQTTMKRFVMCGFCQAEYDDPADRRFHAEPNACPACGPQLELWNASGQCRASGHQALIDCVAAIRDGGIVAVKSIGGFHLIVDACNGLAVERLRARKRRGAKPFALVYPSLAMVRAHCDPTTLEEGLLLAPAAPIVLLRRRRGPGEAPAVTPAVAPRNPYLGIMLPYTPLHYLLMRELGGPVVATSGNLAEEPICIEEHEALERLAGVADLWLVHNRPIARQLDDSVTRIMAGRELVLRRGRGYAPLWLALKEKAPTVVAVGGQLKNTVAISRGHEVLLSQHIGDLDSPQALDAFERELASLARLHGCKAESVVCDLHPDYRSTQYARRGGGRPATVQHHQAHVFSCMAENEIDGPLLGVAWDGSGYGLDGTIWGGEFFRVSESAVERVGHFRGFRLPGGEQAIKEPRRAALGLLYEIFGPAAFEREDLEPVRSFARAPRAVVAGLLRRAFHAPLACSVGRLFDGVAALSGLGLYSSFEGQTAMALEFSLEEVQIEEAYPMGFDDRGEDGSLVVDWAPMIRALLVDLERRVSQGEIAAKFHNALVDVIVAMAHKTGEEKVVLSGGCFQNRYLTEHAVMRLQRAGYRPYWHHRVPPNDGGLALGQVFGAVRAARRR